MEVAMWLCAPLLVPNYVVLVLDNEGSGPTYARSSHTRSYTYELI